MCCYKQTTTIKYLKKRKYSNIKYFWTFKESYISEFNSINDVLADDHTQKYYFILYTLISRYESYFVKF